MNSKLLITGFIAICLGVGIALFAKKSLKVILQDDVESLASCELKDNEGNVLGKCTGELGWCKLSSAIGCNGTKAN